MAWRIYGVTYPVRFCRARGSHSPSCHDGEEGSELDLGPWQENELDQDYAQRDVLLICFGQFIFCSCFPSGTSWSQLLCLCFVLGAGHGSTGVGVFVTTYLLQYTTES